MCWKKRNGGAQLGMGSIVGLHQLGSEPMGLEP